MKHAIMLAVIAILLGFEAVMLHKFRWLYAWFALNFALVSAAYFGLGPRIFGKRADGTLAWWSWILLLPYHLLSYLTWRLKWAIIRRQANATEVSPGLWVGRWPSANDIPGNVTWIIDLTAELPARRAVTRNRRYTNFAVLDAATGPDELFMALADEVAGSSEKVFIHCASGHGRSASVAVVAMVLRGLAPDAESAEHMIRKLRPWVRLNQYQRAQVARVLEKRAVT